MLITVRPGPVLHIWNNGTLVATVPLSFHAALALLRGILSNMENPE